MSSITWALTFEADPSDGLLMGPSNTELGSSVPKSTETPPLRQQTTRQDDES